MKLLKLHRIAGAAVAIQFARLTTCLQDCHHETWKPAAQSHVVFRPFQNLKKTKSTTTAMTTRTMTMTMPMTTTTMTMPMTMTLAMTTKQPTNQRADRQQRVLFWSLGEPGPGSLRDLWLLEMLHLQARMCLCMRRCTFGAVILYYLPSRVLYCCCKCVAIHHVLITRNRFF